MPSSRPWARSFLITLLDLGLLITSSAGLVILLGGRTRFDLGDLRVSLRATGNFAMFAAGFAALRLLLGRGWRPFPAVAPPDFHRIDAERERFAVPERATRTVWLFAAAAFLGSLVWIVPHLRDVRQVTDAGDPLFSAWRVARLAHQLVTDPVHLFDGNIFYPRPLTLTYSDATVLEGLTGAPFILAGGDPLVVANLLTLLAFPACGLAFFYAGWRLTGDPRAALIAALLGAWHPFHSEHYPHLELHWVMFVPLALVAGLRVLARPRASAGFWLGAAVAAQWLASMYIGVMLVSVLVPFLLVVALAWRVRPTWALARAAAAAGVVLLPAFLLLAVPYMQGREARGERSLQEVSNGSALPRDYGATHSRLATYQWHQRAGNRAERELFPGTSTLVLGAAGLVPPLTAASIATAISGAMAFDWSLGLKGLTYDDLYRRSVVHRSMRIPARFSVVVGAALALLAAFGARRIIALGRSPRAQSALCATLAVLVLFDLRIDLRLIPYWRSIPSIYDRVTPNMVLAELPRNHDVEYMYFSTRHWAHLLNGYSGFLPLNMDWESAQNNFPMPAAIDQLRRLGVTHLTYNCRFERRERSCTGIQEQLDANPGLHLLAEERWEGAPVRLYELR